MVKKKKKIALKKDEGLLENVISVTFKNVIMEEYTEHKPHLFCKYP